MGIPISLVHADGPVLLFGGPYSNLEATRALSAEAARLSITPERVICTGDAIAYGADAAPTLDLVRDWGIHMVAGNCEESLANGATDCGCGFPEGSTCEQLSIVWFAHAARQLKADHCVWMRNLPRRIDLEINGFRFAVVHGGVEQINKFIFASHRAEIKAEDIFVRN